MPIRSSGQTLIVICVQLRPPVSYFETAWLGGTNLDYHTPTAPISRVAYEPSVVRCQHLRHLHGYSRSLEWISVNERLPKRTQRQGTQICLRLFLMSMTRWLLYIQIASISHAKFTRGAQSEVCLLGCPGNGLSVPGSQTAPRNLPILMTNPFVATQ
jgi:hypothetical protein